MLLGLGLAILLGSGLLEPISQGTSRCSFKILNVNVGFNEEVKIYLKNVGESVPYSGVSDLSGWEVYLDGSPCEVYGVIASGDSWGSQGILTLMCKCSGVNPRSQYTVSVRLGGSSDNYVYVGS